MTFSMKFPRILAFAAMAAALLSCQDIPLDQTPEGFFIDKSSIEVPFSGGEYSLELSSPTAWSATASDAQWVSISPASGEAGTYDVKVSVNPNPSKESERSAKILISYDNLSFSVKVTQEKNPEEGVFSISQKSFDVPVGGAELEFTVISDAVEYDVTMVEDWISVVSRTGDRHSGETIRIAVSSNDREERTGVVSVCTKDGSCIPVMVNQEGWPAFVRRNIGYRFTATWCGYCPYMDEAFHIVADDPANSFDYITFHADKGYPMNIAEASSLSTYYKVSGYPTGVLNGWKEINNYTTANVTANNVVSAINQFQETFPCVAGISVSTSIDGGTLKVDATVKAFPEEYWITAFVLESGIVETQTYYPPTGGSQKVSDFVHDNVARKMLTENYKGDSFTVADAPVSFTWSTDLDPTWVPENLSVAIVVLRDYGNAYAADKGKRTYPNNYVVNSVTVPAGSSKEMEYAK